MNYLTDLHYGPGGNGVFPDEWTTELLMTANIDSIEGLMRAYEIDYGYTSQVMASRNAQSEPTGWVRNEYMYGELPCQYWEACYEPVVTKGEMPPDALILPGGSGSVAGWLYTVGGAELLLNRSSNEVSGFTYMGQGGGVALEADVSVYGGLVWNLDENINYSGPFTTLTIDLSAAIGGQGSFFWESGTIPFTGETWGFSIGPSSGGGFGVTGSQTEFTCVFGC